MSVRQDRIVVVEPQTCGRRMSDFGPWKREEGLDSWERGRWAPTRENADAEVAEFIATTSPGSSMGDPMWRWGGEQPRTCSFCGGIHPDDAVALIKAGWRVGVTDKRYKRYMEPPQGTGYPLPPVKLYTQHFSPEQIAAFNAALTGE
jgi:hypothetical protein